MNSSPIPLRGRTRLLWLSLGNNFVIPELGLSISATQCRTCVYNTIFPHHLKSLNGLFLVPGHYKCMNIICNFLSSPANRNTSQQIVKLWAYIWNKDKTRAKDVLPNIHSTQAAVSVHTRHPVTPDCDEMMLPAAGWRHLQRTAWDARLTMHCQWGWHSSFPVFLPFNLGLWLSSWHSNAFERWTKHVFPVNLMHIRSTIPEIFEKQTKNLSQTALKTEPYLRAANTMPFSF